MLGLDKIFVCHLITVTICTICSLIFLPFYFIFLSSSDYISERILLLIITCSLIIYDLFLVHNVRIGHKYIEIDNDDRKTLCSSICFTPFPPLILLARLISQYMLVLPSVCFTSWIISVLLFGITLVTGIENRRELERLNKLTIDELKQDSGSGTLITIVIANKKNELNKRAVEEAHELIRNNENKIIDEEIVISYLTDHKLKAYTILSEHNRKVYRLKEIEELKLKEKQLNTMINYFKNKEYFAIETMIEENKKRHSKSKRKRNKDVKL